MSNEPAPVIPNGFGNKFFRYAAYGIGGGLAAMFTVPVVTGAAIVGIVTGLTTTKTGNKLRNDEVPIMTEITSGSSAADPETCFSIEEILSETLVTNPSELRNEVPVDTEITNGADPENFSGIREREILSETFRTEPSVHSDEDSSAEAEAGEPESHLSLNVSIVKVEDSSLVNYSTVSTSSVQDPDSEEEVEVELTDDVSTSEDDEEDVSDTASSSDSDESCEPSERVVTTTPDEVEVESNSDGESCLVSTQQISHK